MTFDGTNWTWMSGSDQSNQKGIYGDIKVPSHLNVPGARYAAMGWRDNYGNFWMFGVLVMMKAQQNKATKTQ
jgi:hypothetical protein